MLKYISDQIRRDSEEVRQNYWNILVLTSYWWQESSYQSSHQSSHQSSPGPSLLSPGGRLTGKPPPGARTLPVRRKVFSSSKLERPRDSVPLLENGRNPARIPPEDLPPALPPKSPQMLRKVSSLSRSQSMPSRNPPGLLRPSGALEPDVKSRSRSQTPSKVTFQADRNPEEKHSFDWVDFKTNGISLSFIQTYVLTQQLEGLPRGVILPESCLHSADVLTKHQEDNDDDDDDLYLSAQEDLEEDQSRGSLLKVNVATQTDPLPSTTCCIL